MWNVPDEMIRKENREYIFRSYADERYFVEVSGIPDLQACCILKEPIFINIVPFATDAKVYSGKLEDGKVTQRFKSIPLDVEDYPTHYVWSPELHDLDGDGTPEVWVRYVRAWAPGISQELVIYKITDKGELALLKHFSGNTEGVARRLDGNRVEVGSGRSDKNLGLKSEITRLARKEVKAATTPMQKKLTTLSRDLAQKKREVTELQQKISRMEKKLDKFQPDMPSVSHEELENARFGPKLLKSQRKRLKLDQYQMAELMNTSVYTIRAWEQGRSNPKDRETLALLVAIRKMGVGEVREKLGIGLKGKKVGRRKKRAKK